MGWTESNAVLGTGAVREGCWKDGSEELFGAAGAGGGWAAGGGKQVGGRVEGDEVRKLSGDDMKLEFKVENLPSQLSFCDQR